MGIHVEVEFAYLVCDELFDNNLVETHAYDVDNFYEIEENFV